MSRFFWKENHKPLWAVVTVHPPLRLSSGNSRSSYANYQTGLGSSILISYLVCHGWYAEMKFSSLNGLDFNKKSIRTKNIQMFSNVEI